MRVATLYLLISVAGLLTFGMVMLYSAVLHASGQNFIFKQICWVTLGVGLGFVVSRLDYRWLQRWCWPLLGFATLLLILVLHPDIGKKLNGARRWFAFGGVSFQPSELAKIALIVFVAWYGERYRRYMPTFWRGLCVPGMVLAGVLGLIFVEPDRGTTVLMGAVTVGMLLVAGVRWVMILPPLLGAGSLLVVSLILDPVRSLRLKAWFNPEAMKDGVGYQSYKSLLALGSGGLDGMGLGNGLQKYGYLPLHQTDFIFSVIGEELGLLGTMGVVLIFVTLILSGMFIALRAKDTFGFLLATGITFLIGLQAFINIGVVTNTLPNKGLALPFISYGGSSLVIMLIAVGLLVSVARYGKTDPLKEPVNVEPEPVPV